jgi:hypothetical protein
MKKAVIFLMVLATVGIVNAALIPNGDFESPIGPGEGWDVWAGGGSVTAAEYTTGGNPGGYVSLNAAAGTWAGWYKPTPLLFSILGAPAGEIITLQADIKNFSGNLNAAGLKLEATGGTPVEFGFRPGVTTDWATYSIELDTNPNNTGLVFSLMTIPADAGGASMDGFDNAELIVGGKALFPIPTVGNSAVAPSSDVLSWINPDPNNPSDTILCDVWFRSSATPLADPNLVPGQPGAVQIVNDEAISSLDLSTKSITLVADRYYYWKVNVIDPNSGGSPIQTDGFTWSFYTGDAPALVNAGTDQYVWLTAGTKTFTLTGSYTDDGKSAVTTTWTLNPLTETDPATITTIATPSVAQGIKTSGSHATTVTVNNTGWFFFDFTATDLAGAAVDTVNVGVYVDACAAAYADPADLKFEADVSGDCKVDLDDLAMLASEWIQCMSTKLGCTP